MVFSSAIFLFIFLPFVLAGYYLLDRRFKNFFLLSASLFFYAWGEPRFVFVMIGSIFVNYLAALAIARYKTKALQKRAKMVLILAVFFNLSLFFVYKYLNFTIQNVNALAALAGRDALVRQTHILLPIGISFFTFQAMSYVFDVYYGKGQVQKNPLNVMLYVSLFPQLIAGPIVRYQTVADEIQNRRETLSDFTYGIARFLIGLAKKAILANTIAVAADAAYNALAAGTLTAGLAWLGAIAYGLQIYFDFSGYSDMAIGLGLMFGFHFLENFDHPYLSTTVSEFWRRWHISLGSWFRDYVYIPMGGSRVKSKARLVLNLLAVWTLTGIWHGANWTFLVWGLMYFALLTFEKLTDLPKKLAGKKGLSALYRGVTMLCVICGWVIFRAESLSEGLGFLAAMFGFAPNGGWNSYTAAMLEQYAVVLLLAIVCCLDWKSMTRKPMTIFREKAPNAVFAVETVVLALVSLAAVSFTVASTYNPFIYFNF